jgi:hypothetical protein
VVDARRGPLKITIAAGKGLLQTGQFSGALFSFTQAVRGLDKGIATLTLVEGIAGVPSLASCKAHTAQDPSRDGPTARAAVNRRVLALLHASARGRFRTRGRYAAGTVRGTDWTTTDRCDGTLITVITHSVEVENLVTHRFFLVHAGHHYFAAAPGPTLKKHPRAVA